MKVSPSLTSKPIVGFLFEPQNKGGGGFPGFSIKIGSYDLVIWASKSSQWFSLFRHQNQTGYNLSVAVQNRWEGDGIGHMSRSRVFQSVLKTGGGAITSGVCGIIAEVASNVS
jgi:hypothetical protein